ncbi:ATP F0F1 synthase subunit B [Enterovirga rhinocerotis]|uniref:ATP synthase subunit b n=1 Tax=Enterovirga rhinocerotis TaxID=1339210 RepID=A0A4R7CBS0_9HYPH|nr:ATP F0F1 synthase subunit B [Enterovirga rhinocerotis]TDR94556.1 F-type H+-transporting ATPase subunit b [Enterovirga rhinocerotis]
MFATPDFWVAVSFFAFLGLVWKAGGFRMIIGALDKRGERIRHELDEAKRLREEAAALLADYQKKRGEAEKEAEEIVSNARSEAERVARDASERLADFVQRRTAAAETRIAQAEAKATQDVRDAATEAAIKASETVLRDQLRGDGSRELLERSLGEVRTKLHS